MVALAIEDPALLASVLTQLADAITPPVVPEPTEHEQAQIDAAAAAATAKTASEDAATASTAAAEAVANLATVQTGATSAALAKEAADYAAKAMAAYADAKKASEDAAAAEDLTAAVEARLLAELATVDAVSYSMTAVKKGTAAETAANADLIIVGTVKTVGGTSLDATAGASTVTTDGYTVTTGLLAKGDQPMHTADATTGLPGVPADLTVTKNPYVAPTVGAAARTFPIGKLVDSADDMARLMIVTQYASSKPVSVYKAGIDDENRGTKAGYLTIDDDDDTTGITVEGTDGLVDSNNVALKYEGTYYLAGIGGGAPAAGDEVDKDAKAVEVFFLRRSQQQQCERSDDVRGVEG